MNKCFKPTRTVLIAVGSFNPPTNMHLRIFELAKDFLQKNDHEVLGGIISPVHDQYGKKGLVTAEHRCSMLKLAVETSNWVNISEWETQQEGWTRTAESLKFYKKALNDINSEFDWAKKIQAKMLDKEFPLNINLKLLCGADLIESFAVPGLWKDEDIEDIVSNYGLVVISRSGSNPQQFIYESDLLTRLQRNISIVPEWITNEISSTKIRRALSRGESVRYLTSDSVIDYIQTNRLYIQ
ncbi:nicotinamide/nicotinic acid mononucleotide adenylyltransferase 1-like [Daphnia pulex]|uniref:nicotinamide/nicotinic acid mononucleotide adenylyltransferase 1-like n=1 Tax=Daphnia pulex TaxID=6669 RepID=UPI001EDD5B8B|nr:nicotinamide/nicotinic acid mononucleotide adenylyltransferase 1-like [Daphnia pulex]